LGPRRLLASRPEIGRETRDDADHLLEVRASEAVDHGVGLPGEAPGQGEEDVELAADGELAEVAAGAGADRERLDRLGPQRDGRPEPDLNGLAHEISSAPAPSKRTAMFASSVLPV